MASSTEFPILGYSLVRVKGAASKLRVRGEKGFKYAMEIEIGDGSMQLQATVDPDIIETHIGKFVQMKMPLSLINKSTNQFLTKGSLPLSLA